MDIKPFVVDLSRFDRIDARSRREVLGILPLYYLNLIFKNVKNSCTDG